MGKEKFAYITHVKSKIDVEKVKEENYYGRNAEMVVFNITVKTTKTIWRSIQTQGLKIILVDYDLIRNKRWWRFLKDIGGKEALDGFSVGDTMDLY